VITVLVLGSMKSASFAAIDQMWKIKKRINHANNQPTKTPNPGSWLKAAYPIAYLIFKNSL